MWLLFHLLHHRQPRGGNAYCTASNLKIIVLKPSSQIASIASFVNVLTGCLFRKSPLRARTIERYYLSGNLREICLECNKVKT